MRFVAKLAAVMLISGAVVFAQQPAQPPTFRSQAELVTVPVVITDHSGTHVSGLKKEDFTVLENGVEQRLALCEEVRTTTDRVKRQPPAGNTYSNYLMGTPTARRITIIALDSINTPFADQAYARSQLMKFLENWAASAEPMALVVITRSGVKTIHDFTTDPRVLSAAIRRVRARLDQVGDQPTGEAGPDETAVTAEEQALAAFQAEAEENFAAFQRRFAATLTMQALQEIAQAFAGVPGRKSLIWASSGFPFSISDQTMGLAPAGRDTLSDVLPLYHRTWQVLNDAQFAVYPVDLRGLVVISPSASVARPSRNFHQQMNWNNQERIATFQTVADATGGRAFYNTNDLAGAFRKAADDSSSYYMLGYYRDVKDNKPGWRKLKVAAKRSGVQVRARSGFFVQTAAANSDDERKRELSMAFSSPIEYTALGFQVTWDPSTAAADGKKHAPFKIVLPADAVEVDSDDTNHVKIDFFAVAKTPAGQRVADAGKTVEGHLKPETVQQIKTSGITYNGQLDVPPGEYNVRFVVRDELSGRIGTVSAPLKIE